MSYGGIAYAFATELKRKNRTPDKSAAAGQRKDPSNGDVSKGDICNQPLFARLTPSIDALMVCNEKTGGPRHHVATFQRTAATNHVKTIVKREPLETRRTI